MKYLILIMTLFVSTLNAQMHDRVFMGDCSSLDSKEKAIFIMYPYLAYDSLYKYTNMLLCEGVTEHRKINVPFSEINFSGNTYHMEDLFVYVIYQSLDTNNLHEYVFELKNSNDSVVAVDYGSREFVSADSSLNFYKSYFLQVDYVDVNGSTYSSTDTNEITVFYNSSTHYLKKIIDIDRSKVVGIKYYSSANNEEYVYFFDPNN